jgi:hypothetical protein
MLGGSGAVARGARDAPERPVGHADVQRHPVGLAQRERPARRLPRPGAVAGGAVRLAQQREHPALPAASRAGLELLTGSLERRDGRRGIAPFQMRGAEHPAEQCGGHRVP